MFVYIRDDNRIILIVSINIVMLNLGLFIIILGVAGREFF